MNDHTLPRIIHGHVDAGLLRLRDAQIYSTRFQRDPMPVDHVRAVLLVLPGPPGADTLLEFFGRMALENERLKKQVEELEQSCMQMASELVTDADDNGLRRELAESDDFADSLNGGFSDESDPTIRIIPPPPVPPPDRIIREGQEPRHPGRT